MLASLYKRDSKGKIRVWSVTTDGPAICVSHGVLDGKIQIKTTYAEPKNVGKANATTAEEQAVLEAQAKWLHQVNIEDYAPQVDLAGRQIRPMLALDYHKDAHRLDWDKTVAQPKLDGFRMLAGRRHKYVYDQFTTMTRKGELLEVDHLDVILKLLFKTVNDISPEPCLALDGELYLHGLPLNTISSYAKRYQKGKTEQLCYYVFDLVIPNMPFRGRAAILKRAFNRLHERHRRLDRQLVLVEHQFVTPETLKEYMDMCLFDGYEGVMLRNVDSEYELDKRSAGLIKYKHFYDDEFKIVSAWKDKDGCIMFTCTTQKGRQLACGTIPAESQEFDCTPKMPKAERKHMMFNAQDYVGKYLTVKYQQLTYPRQVPLFPVGLAIRDCDDEGNPLN